MSAQNDEQRSSRVCTNVTMSSEQYETQNLRQQAQVTPVQKTSSTLFAGLLERAILPALFPKPKPEATGYGYRAM